MSRIIPLMLLLGTSCATIVQGPRQEIPVRSTPAGAKVLVNGNEKGRTPLTLSLWREETNQIDVRKEGYYSQTVNLSKHFSYWSLGNLLLGIPFGLVGGVIDMLSGSAYKLNPKEADITLIPRKPTEE